MKSFLWKPLNISNKVKVYRKLQRELLQCRREIISSDSKSVREEKLYINRKVKKHGKF